MASLEDGMTKFAKMVLRLERGLPSNQVQLLALHFSMQVTGLQWSGRKTMMLVAFRLDTSSACLLHDLHVKRGKLYSQWILTLSIHILPAKDMLIGGCMPTEWHLTKHAAPSLAIHLACVPCRW